MYLFCTNFVPIILIIRGTAERSTKQQERKIVVALIEAIFLREILEEWLFSFRRMFGKLSEGKRCTQRFKESMKQRRQQTWYLRVVSESLLLPSEALTGTIGHLMMDEIEKEALPETS